MSFRSSHSTMNVRPHRRRARRKNKGRFHNSLSLLNRCFERLADTSTSACRLTPRRSRQIHAAQSATRCVRIQRGVLPIWREQMHRVENRPSSQCLHYRVPASLIITLGLTATFATLRSASRARGVSRTRPPAAPPYWRAAPASNGTSQPVVLWHS